jgi:hypothetical protein
MREWLCCCCCSIDSTKMARNFCFLEKTECLLPVSNQSFHVSVNFSVRAHSHWTPSWAWRDQTKLIEWPFILRAEQLKTVWQPVLTCERYSMLQQLHVLSLMTMFGVEITHWIERNFLGAQNKCLVLKFRGISSSFRPVISKVGCAWCSTRVQEENKPCTPSDSRMYTY